MSNNQSLSKLIGQMAVIASVHMSTPGLTRLDKAASLKADRDHNAREGTMKGQVSRMPGAEADIEVIKALDRQVRKLLLGYTTAWGLDRRLLPNIYIDEFAGKFEDFRRERDGLVKAFLAKSGDLISLSRQNLGSYTVQPPTVEELRASFGFGFDLTPVPDVGGYSTADKALEKAMKERFADDVAASFHNAQRDMMVRLAAPLENLIDRMNEYDARLRRKDKGKLSPTDKTGTFKATVVTNITDIASIVRAFNFTNDAKIEEIATKLDVFSEINHEVLTKRPEVRKAVAARAAEVRASLSAWLD